MNEEKVTVGKYASSLRKHLFAEHLGILNQCHRHYAGDQINPIDLIDPVSDDFYNKWLATSANNTKIYEEVT